MTPAIGAADRRVARVATIVFAAFATLTALQAALVGHAYAVVLVALAVVVSLRSSAAVGGIAFLVAGVALRVIFIGLDGYGDQIEVSQVAARAVLAGEEPYGRMFPLRLAPAPFPYGPLALAWFLPGFVVELVASVATMGLLWATRSWLTLAFYSGVGYAIYAASMGSNDISPGLLLAAGLVLARSRRRRDVLVGALLVGAAAALKPYAFAWFPGVLGFGGVTALVGLVAATAVLWSPLLLWGIDSFLRSIELARGVHPEPELGLDIPILRLLALPAAAASFLSRSWELMVVLGAAAFAAVLLFDRWASPGYVLAALPVLGIALEPALRRVITRSTRAPVPA